MISLEGKHVVVTGGTGALGTAVVRLLLEEGATCHIPWLVPAERERFPLAGDPRVTLSGPVDLVDEAAVERYFTRIPTPWASIHLAGGFEMRPLTETSGNDLRRMLDMNLVTCFFCCREAVRRMREGGEGGRLVNVAARPALVPTAGMSAYTIAKAGVAALTAALAEELADERIWVNAVAPSVIDTPANREAMPDADADRWPTPEQLAETITYLASPANRVTRGAVIPVYGRS